jgi:hypothetical protein
MSYKKRSRSGYSTGKRYKKHSNRTERQYEKDEIRQQMTEITQGDEYREKGGGRNPNYIARQEYNISVYERWMIHAKSYRERWGRDSYFSVAKCKAWIEKAKKKIEKLRGEK